MIFLDLYFIRPDVNGATTDHSCPAVCPIRSGRPPARCRGRTSRQPSQDPVDLDLPLLGSEPEPSAGLSQVVEALGDGQPANDPRARLVHFVEGGDVRLRDRRGLGCAQIRLEIRDVECEVAGRTVIPIDVPNPLAIVEELSELEITMEQRGTGKGFAGRFNQPHEFLDEPSASRKASRQIPGRRIEASLPASSPELHAG